MIRAPHAVLLVAAAVACLCKPSLSLFTGPRPIRSQLESVNTRPVTADLVKIREALGIALVNDMYLDRPYISPEKAQPYGTSDGVGRPAFSHVHSIFEAGQKGPLLGRPGVWIRQTNATMVLSFHDGCPLQLYRILSDGELHTEIVGSPLTSPSFRPTTVLRPGELVTLESLCADRATLVSFVTVPAWNPRLREELDPTKMAAEYPQHAQLISRLASHEFNADRGPLFSTSDTAAAPEGAAEATGDGQ